MATKVKYNPNFNHSEIYRKEYPSFLRTIKHPYRHQLLLRDLFSRYPSTCSVLPRQCGKTEVHQDDFLSFVFNSNVLEPICTVLGPNISHVMDIHFQRLKFKLSDYSKRFWRARESDSEILVDRVKRVRTKKGTISRMFTSSLKFFGMARAESVEGISGDYLFIDEFGLIDDRRLTLSVLPAFLKNKALIRSTGTVRGRNAFYLHYKESLSNINKGALLKTCWDICDESHVPYTREQLVGWRNDYKSYGRLSDFKRAYECDWDSGTSGSLYGDLFRDLETKRFSVNRDYPVHLSFDIGVGRNLICWLWQHIDGYWNFIDVLRDDDGKGLSNIYEKLHERGYKYGLHVYPHDISKRGTLHGVSLYDDVSNLLKLYTGGQICVIPREMGNESRIHAVQKAHKFCSFSSSCEEGLNHLRLFSYDEVTKRVKRTRAGHEHYADAFGISFLVDTAMLQAYNTLSSYRNKVHPVIMGYGV